MQYQPLQTVNDEKLYSNKTITAIYNVIKSDVKHGPNIIDDFEEVFIDGSSFISVPTTDIKHFSEKLAICNPCKIYFPTEHMHGMHLKTVHNDNKLVRKKKTKSILDQLKETAGGYRKNTTESYICNYCSYTSNIRSELTSHVTRKHGNFRKALSVRTRTVTLAIEPASVKIKNEPTESECGSKFKKLKADEKIFDSNSESMTEPIESMNKKIEIIDEGIEIIRKEMDFLKNECIFADESGNKLSARQNKLYNCPYCQFQCIKRSTMKSHITSKHNKEWKEAIGQRENLLTNEALKGYFSKKRNQACYYCHFAATTRSTLNAHTRRKHPGYLQPIKSRKQPPTEMFCDQCNFKTMDRHKMQMHIERKHVTECRYTCEYCGKKFKVKCDLTSHVRFQHFKTPAVCDVCGKICSNSNALRVHQKREHYKPDFECNLCKRRMVSQENLDEHIQRQHEQRIKLICEQCGRVFDQHNKLRQHAMTHTGEKPHNCHVCGKSFARRAVFRQHLLIHTGQRPYVCDICGKSFTQKPGLICHRKMHPGDKPPLPVVYIDHILDKFVQKTDENNEL